MELSSFWQKIQRWIVGQFATELEAQRQNQATNNPRLATPSAPVAAACSSCCCCCCSEALPAPNNTATPVRTVPSPAGDGGGAATAGREAQKWAPNNPQPAAPSAASPCWEAAKDPIAAAGGGGGSSSSSRGALPSPYNAETPVGTVSRLSAPAGVCGASGGAVVVLAPGSPSCNNGQHGLEIWASSSRDYRHDSQISCMVSYMVLYHISYHLI
jgi:hypothetical protein